MAVGLGVLQLSPRQLWEMTVPEFSAAVAGLTGSYDEDFAPMDRDELINLMELFPD